MMLLAHFGKALVWLAALTALLLSGPLLTLAFGSATVRGDWRTATHRSAGIAPDPAAHPEAIVQVYASRTFGWRGAFAVHTWVAAKPADAERYTRYEVIGWRALGGGSALSVSEGAPPDAEWYGAAPVLIGDIRGAQAEAVIAKLPQAAQRYPLRVSLQRLARPQQQHVRRASGARDSRIARSTCRRSPSARTSCPTGSWCRRRRAARAGRSRSAASWA